MSRATAVRHPGKPVTLAPAGNISFEIESRQRFRLTQPEGEQVADFVAFNRDDVRELLSMHSSRAVNVEALGAACPLRQPHVADVEDRGGPYGRELLRRLLHLNAARCGAKKDAGAANCQANLQAAVGGYGIDRWSFNIDACFNVFMTVAYDADGV